LAQSVPQRLVRFGRIKNFGAYVIVDATSDQYLGVVYSSEIVAVGRPENSMFETFYGELRRRIASEQGWKVCH
tara:strand:- start:1443 stop:1661 length:219 start_codon:yes stop_codon:yes gene_type:complete